MSMAPVVQNNYERQFIITNNALDKFRALVKGVCCEGSEEIKDILDRAVCSEGLGNAEEWWEEDRDSSIQFNRVIRIDDHVSELDDEFRREDRLYAIIRKNKDGQDVVITVLNKYSYDGAIRHGRWSPQQMRKTRRKNSETPSTSDEPMNMPFAELRDIRDQFPDKPQEVQEMPEKPQEPPWLITHGDSFVIADDIKVTIAKLIDDGVHPDDIVVWKRTPIRLKVSIKLEGI